MRQYEAFIDDLQGEYETDPAQTGGVVLQHGLTAYVPVIFGCNEVCSFCIVPFVRGTERSRPLQDVVDDVRRFADQGVREVTLLGQTVNSYRDPDTKAGLAALLEAVERVPGIWRVRFLTSHPRHVHDDLLFAIRDLPRVCEHCTCHSSPATTPSSSRCAVATRSTSTVRSSPTPAMSSPTSPSRPMSSLAIRVRRRSNSREHWPCWKKSSSTSSTSRAFLRDHARRRPARRTMWRLPKRNAASTCCSRP